MAEQSLELIHEHRAAPLSPHREDIGDIRVAGTGELRVGQGTETFRGRELSDEEKVPVLHAYLKRWRIEVGAFSDGVGPDSSDAEILAIAEAPAFEVLPVL